MRRGPTLYGHSLIFKGIGQLVASMHAMISRLHALVINLFDWSIPATHEKNDVTAGKYYELCKALTRKRPRV